MLAIVGAITLLSPGLQNQPLDFVGVPITSLLARLQTGATALTRNVGGIWKRYIALVHTHQENERLAKELQRTESEVLRLQELVMENTRLQHLLEFKRASSFNKLTTATVVGRDPTNWHRTIMINKGGRDGLQKDMGVITPVGVVGRIIRTTPVASQVLLLTDQNSSAAGLVQRTRDEGLVEGTHRGIARIKYLPILSEIEVGDIVLTSGLAGIFPKGLMVGQVSNIQIKEDKLFKVAQIKPAVDFARLEEVLVIIRQ